MRSNDGSPDDDTTTIQANWFSTVDLFWVAEDVPDTDKSRLGTDNAISTIAYWLYILALSHVSCPSGLCK